jgi:dGTPase
MTHSYLIQPLALAPFACHPEKSRGRRVQERESSNRTVFQRDRDRIIHSAAFRRLEYKTQVFVNHEGDHYRTRLTHSLEVAQLARSLARSLRLNEDVAEAVALAHDVGHPPFGHAGEDALREVMREYQGFDHNAQTIRVLTHLEQRYADFDGLNLSWEVLEGVAKHNGPVKKLHPTLRAYQELHDLELHTWPSLEAQIASLADDIAYHNHDMDDGLRAQLFTSDDLCSLPLIGEKFAEVMTQYPHLQPNRLVHEAIRRVINAMVMDLLEQTSRNLEALNAQSVEEIRHAGKPLAAFSPSMQIVHRKLRAFLMERMYRHYKVNRMTSKARRIVQQLFRFFMEEPECLPTDWRNLVAEAADATQQAIIIADYIAGMTDRFAIQEHRRIFDLSSQEAQG